MTVGCVQAHRRRISGLDYCIHEWDGGGQTTVILLHGFLDVGLSWSFVAEALSKTNLHLVAPDWRGHGDSDRIGAGGYYHFVDYARDLEQIVTEFRREKVVLVGHSMGAMAALLWAGARPGGLHGLMVVDGTGPLPVSPAEYPERVSRWLDQVAPFRADAFQRQLRSLDDVVARLAKTRPNHGRERLMRLAQWLTCEVEDDRLVWKHDPLHRTRSPLPMAPAVVNAFWRRISCPIFWVSGEKSPWNTNDVTQWIGGNQNVRRHRVLPGIGHLVHTEAPEALASELQEAVHSLAK